MSFAKKAKELVSKMSLEEKASQMRFIRLLQRGWAFPLTTGGMSAYTEYPIRERISPTFPTLRITVWKTAHTNSSRAILYTNSDTDLHTPKQTKNGSTRTQLSLKTSEIWIPIIPYLNSNTSHTKIFADSKRYLSARVKG